MDASYDQERLARRERMKEEKKRQAAMRAMLKRMIPLVIIGLIAVIAMIVVIVWGIRSLVDKHKVEEPEQAMEVQVPEVPVVIEEPVIKESEIQNMLPITVERPELFEGYKPDASGADVSITQ